MKRCKLLIDWFADWIGQFDWEQIVGFTISGLLGIALAIMIFVYTDKVPAISSDYKQLEDQVNSIQQNPELLMEIDCNININGEIVTVEIENDECKMTAKYDKDLEVVSTSKEDKSMFWLWALVLGLSVGGVEIYFVGAILTVGIFLLEIVVAWIFERVKKINAKFQNK